jgi:cell division protein FtsL
MNRTARNIRHKYDTVSMSETGYVIIAVVLLMMTMVSIITISNKVTYDTQGNRMSESLHICAHKEKRKLQSDVLCPFVSIYLNLLASPWTMQHQVVD